MFFLNTGLFVKTLWQQYFLFHRQIL